MDTQLNHIDQRCFIVKITNYCNLDCTYCYVNKKKSKLRMSLQTIKEIILQTEDLKEDIISFIWHGGEPLLYGIDFFQNIVDLQKRSKKYYTNEIQTNGLLLNSEMIEFFKQNEFNIGISIDFPENTHNNNRVYPDKEYHKVNTFKMVRDKIRLAKKNKLPVSIISVLGDELPTAKEIISFMVNENVPIASLNLRFDLSWSENENIENQISKLLIDIYEIQKKEGLRLSVREIKLVIESILSFQLTDFCQYDIKFCGHKYNAIDESGNLFICCDKFIDSDFKWSRLGNIHDVPIKKMLNSEEHMVLISNFDKLRRDCANQCSIKSLCNGGCIFDILKSKNIKKSIICACKKKLFKHISDDFSGDLS